jgi:hypothetical protein
MSGQAGAQSGVYFNNLNDIQPSAHQDYNYQQQGTKNGQQTSST